LTIGNGIHEFVTEMVAVLKNQVISVRAESVPKLGDHFVQNLVIGHFRLV